MYKCPKCGVTSNEAGNCSNCNVPMVAGEPGSDTGSGSEATTENQPQEGK